MEISSTSAVEQDSVPLALRSFPLFWGSQAKEDQSGEPLSKDDWKTECTAEEDMRADSEPQTITPNVPPFWDKQTERDEPLTADMFAGSGR
ncbi:hypothetical protein AZE42_13711 [Rhizopogon vesiculosus]|uniref:Uncharacterized protein n=1 Tax=Rhizopogon vesiculosus TaxID=180088 RepID=A0A1J8QT41_9AGAM|nr:hypothetical protein AZE42_13711 [Rhizopogon vesiculosus]